MAEPPQDETEALLGRFWNQNVPERSADALEGIGGLLEALRDVLAGLSSEAGRKKLAEKWEGVDKGLRDMNLDAFDRIMAESGMAEADRKAVRDSLAKGFPGFAILGLLLSAGTALAIGWLLKPLMDGLAGRLQRHINRVARPNLIPLGDFWEYATRQDKPGVYREWGALLGISDEQLDIFDAASRKHPDLSMASKLHALKDLAPEEVKAYLKRSGWSTDARDPAGKLLSERLAGLIETPPGLGNLMELLWRRQITNAEYAQGLRELGFTPKWQKALLQVKYNPPPLGEAIELWRRGLIDEKTLGKHLEANGLDDQRREAYFKLRYANADYWQAREWYLRGLIGKDEFYSRMGRLGFDDFAQKATEEAAWLLPGPSDLVRFGVREVFTPAIREHFGQMLQKPSREWYDLGKKIGYKPETLDMYWAAHWDLPSAGEGFQLYHRGEIDRDTLIELLRALDIMPFWQEKMIALSFNLIPRRQLRALEKQKLLDFNGLWQRYRKLGYSDEDARLMAQSDILANQEDYKRLTTAQIIDAYARGWASRPELADYLKALEYGDAEVKYWLALADTKRGGADATANLTELQDLTKEARDLSRADVLQFYKDGAIDRKAAEAYLTDMGYDSESRRYLLDHADLERSKEDLDFKAKQVKRLFDAHLLTATDAEARLTAWGFPQEQAKRLTVLWAIQRETEDRLAEVRDRKPTAADLKDWLKKGVISADEWIDYMGRLGYDDEWILQYYKELIVDLGA